MEPAARNTWSMIAVSFVIAMLLAVYPISIEWRWVRPEFIALLGIYWAVYLPHRIGPGVLWILGIVQDVVEGTPLGLHALGLVVIAYICLLSYQRLRSFETWQQAFWVFVLVGIHQLFGNWVHSLSGNESAVFLFLLPALSSALCWPIQVYLLDKLRLRYRVT
jgi:rod shape-determining protein MreD